MPFLIALVALLAAVCLTDLLLTVGVIRRLRVHSELLSGSTRPQDDPVMAPGGTVGPFSAVTVGGVEISDATLPVPALVGVFSPGCPACAERLPLFAERARAFPGGREHVLAVLTGTEPEVAAERDALVGVARVVIEPPGTGVSRALRVRGFPSFALLGAGGTVLASGVTLDVLDDAPATA
ncbi:hypothetical protein JOL79_09790 [Microbispora sp. RL4-1S]|uniref:Thioredoxin domain-containing protein n=1 Tax=Microbispora oryzae TaxID=2806554 RepID=A0A940WMC4_9ACTN|nr:hypothetical protein [Microbispora oryzae]MBP2704100.1 hypothetical protein [Microbispora oryzae]